MCYQKTTLPYIIVYHTELILSRHKSLYIKWLGRNSGGFGRTFGPNFSARAISQKPVLGGLFVGDRLIWEGVRGAEFFDDLAEL